MEDFLDKLQKTKSGFLSRMRLLFILDLISVFSVFYAIFIIFRLEFFLGKVTLPFPVNYIPPALAFIIAITAALLLHKKDSRINVILLIENKYPELKEKLRTAYDNRDEINVIVESLKQSVSDAMATVSSSNLIAARTMVAKILIAVIFISGTIFVSLNPEQYSIPENTLTNISNAITGNTEGGPNISTPVVGQPETINKIGATGGGDILGKPKIASIEGTSIDLTIYTGSGTGFTVKSASQQQNQFIQSAAFPVDVLGSNVSDGGYGLLMQKTETEKQLIDKYAVERSKI